MGLLPPFLMTSEHGSFARETIEKRKPLIIDQILQDFDYTPTIRKELLLFKIELGSEKIQPLREKTSDREIWDHDIQPWLGKSWLEIPWFFAECFFYRRVLEIVRYFQPGPWNGQDPYRLLKEKELLNALTVFEKLQKTLLPIASYDNFCKFSYRAMWGNRGDLSNLNVFDTDMSEQKESIILDQTQAAFDFLKNTPAKIAYFLDNTGRELLFDLAFVDYLLQSKLASSITLYLKNQPFFVSDATLDDFRKAMDIISMSEFEETKMISARLSDDLKLGKISLLTPPFLTTSAMFRKMPGVTYRQIAEHDLVILKGDVNYRRLFDDRHWDPTTPISEAAGYFPTSFLSLRTLKSELVLGIDHSLFECLNQNAEPGWMINGKRGMLTFYNKD